MSKFHVNANGEAGKCRAQNGNCPFGGASEHFDNVQEAQQAAEQKMEQQFSEVKTVSKKQGEFVDTFGEHTVGAYEPHNSTRSVMKLINPERHSDGSYTLHIDATDYVRGDDGQNNMYWNFPSDVVLHHDDEDFLSITSREQAEQAAQKIADNANKDIYENYITSPNNDVSPEEEIAEQYENTYGSKAPVFDVKFHDTVEVVDTDDLMEYWEDNREDND